MALLSIQYLRAVAAMLVVLFHLHLQFERLGHAGFWPSWLASGVDIFFVISGCIMWITTEGRPPTPAMFYLKRVVRIVPLYWLLTSLMVAITLLSPSLLQSLRFDPAHVLASYAFLPWPHPVSGLLEPALIPGWTLNYEMFFYAVFGAALVLPPGARLATVAVFLAALVTLGAVLRPTSAAGSFYTADIILEFVLGMVIGRMATRGRLLPAGFARLALAAGAVAIPVTTAIAPELPRLLGWGLPAAAIVLAALSLERAHGMPALALPRLLGDASYSIYLSHGMVLAAMSRFWHLVPLAGPLSPALFAVVATATAALGGVILYFAVERPLTRLLRPAATVA